MTSRRSFLAGAAAVGFASLGWSPARAQSGALSVVATTGMIADTARAIAGDAAVVRALMGPGVDPHAYRQTRSDIAALLGSDLVLWNGLFLEAQMEGFLDELAERKPVVAVGEAVPVELRLAHDDYDDKFDPHVWMNPELWGAVAMAIAEAMSAARPEAADGFVARLADYRTELGALDAYQRQVLASVPEESRVLVTAHDAFNYFGFAYGYEVLGVQGVSTDSEAGLNRIAELVDTLVDRRVGAVFVETSVSDRNVRALIEGAAARGHEVRVGGELFSDAMGPDGSYEGTYLGMIDHNATVIARALGGEAPAAGRLGKLSAA